MKVFGWNLLVVFIAALLPLTIYAMRKNWDKIQWRYVITDNFARLIGMIILVFAVSFAISYEPTLVEVITASIGINTTSAALIGLGIGGFTVALLPSDTGLKQSV